MADRAYAARLRTGSSSRRCFAVCDEPQVLGRSGQVTVGSEGVLVRRGCGRGSTIEIQ